MPRLSANLSWLFSEVPLRDRFAAAAACGFRGVEVLYPYALPAADVTASLRNNGLELALINLPPGDLTKGERGFAARPGDEDRFDSALETALAYVRACGGTRLHAMSGMRIDGLALVAHEDTLVANLKRAAPIAAAAGVTLTIEPLNATDNPGYVLTSSEQALAILDRVAQPNVALQLDVYHTHITEGDAVRRAFELRGRFAHVQIAGFPGRHEPGAGEIDAPAVFAQLDADGYGGWVGLEYEPRASTREGLAWAAPYLNAK